MPIDTIARAIYNSGKDEWDRFVSNIAVPVVNTIIDPIWKNSDSVERALAKVEPTSSNKPQLDTPLPMDEKTFEIGKKGLTRLVEPQQLEDESSVTDIDELVHDLLLTLARDSSVYLQSKRDYFNLERKWGQSKEIERTTELQNQVDATKTVNTWGKVEQSVASAGLIISGALAVASGGGAVVLGVGAIALGTVILIDQILDDAAKKVVAKWVAKGNEEEEASWVNRIQMFAGLSAFALSFGVSPSTSVQVAMDVSKGTVGTIKDVFQWRLSVQKSNVMQLDADTKISQKTIDTLFTEIQEICNEINQFHENLHHIEEKKQKVAHSMLKFADA